MCGIFGFCSANKKLSLKQIGMILIQGLEKVEYRGYDSAGMCILKGSEPVVYQKAKGKVDNLKEKLEKLYVDDNSDLGEYMCIAHTRWATHGESSEKNAHPVRSDPDGTFFVVHNGIISNYKQQKELLISKGYKFETDTDTEIAAKLCLYHYQQNPNLTFLELVKKVLNDCKGQYAFLFVSPKYPGELIASQYGAPMVLGIKNPSEHGFSFDPLRICHSMKANDQTDFIISSDVASIVEHTLNVVYINEGDIMVVRNDGVEIYNSSMDKSSKTFITKLDPELSSVDKGMYQHYMLKEIHEQIESVLNTTRNRIDFEKYTVKLDTLEKHIEKISKAERYIFVSCGTSYHSSLATRKIFGELTGKSVSVEVASDFIDLEPHIDEKDVVFFISQSGETADTIQAMNYCISRNATTIGITNTRNSTISRKATCNFDIRAGIEKGVASTKAYTSQFLSIVLIGVYISQNQGTNRSRRIEILKEIGKLSEKINRCLEINLSRPLDILSMSSSILVIGRGYQAPTSVEGALKIKEISCICSQGIYAGELKHGPIALVTPEIGIIVMISNDKFYEKSHNAYEQIRARGGNPIIICPESIKSNYNDTVLVIPDTIDCLQGILSVIPLQLIAYNLAIIKGYDPDFPRNLAKSVTVE